MQDPRSPRLERPFALRVLGALVLLSELRSSLHGRKVHLSLQPARVLCLLAARRGHLVTREEIRAHLWGNDTYVDTELGLNYCVKTIRSALRDSARAPRFVETPPRRGYRFIAPVESGDASPPPATQVRRPVRPEAREAAHRALADHLAGQADTPAGNAPEVAAFYAIGLEPDRAFAWLEKAFERRTPGLLHVPVGPFFDPIRADPRIDDLCRRVGPPVEPA